MRFWSTSCSEPGLVALLRRREACGDRSLARGGRRSPVQPPPPPPTTSAAAADTLRGFHPTAPPAQLAHHTSGPASDDAYAYSSRGPAKMPRLEQQQKSVPSPGAAAAGPALHSWAEDDFLRHCAASYCPLTPSPRSTIDLDFSHDGRLLASSQCVCCS